jgi:hypothetical protein
MPGLAPVVLVVPAGELFAWHTMLDLRVRARQRAGLVPLAGMAEALVALSQQADERTDSGNPPQSCGSPRPLTGEVSTVQAAARLGVRPRQARNVLRGAGVSRRRAGRGVVWAAAGVNAVIAARRA